MLSLTESFRREYFAAGSTQQPQSREIFQRKHVVFVAGLLNEAAQLVQNYYCDNMAEARAMGFKVSYLGYLSCYTVPANADRLLNDIQKLYAVVKLPIILVGHSKGGAECMYLTLKYPELLLSNLIERVILVHPALGGSPLADNVATNFMGKSFTRYLGDGLYSIQVKTLKFLSFELY